MVNVDCVRFGLKFGRVVGALTTSKNLLYVMTEWVGLEGTFEDHPVGSPCCGQGHTPLDRAAQSPLQRDFGGALTTSLGNLFQRLTTFVMKNFFLTSSLPYFSSKRLMSFLSYKFISHMGGFSSPGCIRSMLCSLDLLLYLPCSLNKSLNKGPLLSIFYDRYVVM